MTRSTNTLTDAERDAVLRIADACHQTDGVAPFNESATLAIRGSRPATFLLADDGLGVVGAATLDPRERTIQLAVDPAHRRLGHGTALLEEALAEQPDHAVWAFGTLPAAVALAARLDLVPVRELLKLGREIGPEEVPPTPDGYRLATYEPGDAPGIVATNAAAFAEHPEQGQLDLEGFSTLAAQDWFDPQGLVVAKRDDEVVGFHWTKRHGPDLGEVYVLAVHPDHAGQGLGKVLLAAGLTHLAEQGCTEVVLYVEADQPRAVGLYRSASFVDVGKDTQFRLQGE